MNKKALLVGIDDYCGVAENLNGCVKDAEDLAELLSWNYCEESGISSETNFSCKVITTSSEGPKITRSLIKNEIKLLFEDEEAEVVLFYFSGHGFENSLGGALVTPDAQTYEEGISFNDLIDYANHAIDKEVFIILDCCKSGNLGDLILSNNQFSNLRQGVSIMTASNAKQLSWDTETGGVFTQLICNALRGGSADLQGNVTFLKLYRHAESLLGAWEQRPTLKVNTRKNIVLKKVEPTVPENILRKILEYFPTPESRFQLDPEFESDNNLGNYQKEFQFSELQLLANNGIVKPLKEKFMYYAAMRSDKCQLSLLGRQYWLLMEGKISATNSYHDLR